ncbi:hypothetical protein AYI69_g10828 [Smittium culicis]|uniref:Uncharacterized protein n=1 Tax=Smittium culicis TaxID=133412 RepID=A0A1R1X371_9FUNG|nr:hypothetical protein AYI69_g10828 [Smittium culicis]
MKHKSCRKYLRFCSNVQSYQLRVIPIGLSLSPHTITKILRLVLNLAQTQKIRETDKRRKDVAHIPSELYKKGTSDFSGAPTATINATPTAGAEEPILVEELILEIDRLPYRRSNVESTVMERKFEIMEWFLVPTGNTRS